MSWLKNVFELKEKETSQGRVSRIPDGVWSLCTACNSTLYRPDMERNLNVCPKCSYHMRIKARTRLECFLDKGKRTELGQEIRSQDRLQFRDLKKYKDRLLQAKKESQETEALVVMSGSMKGQALVAAAFEFSFMGGSMGSVVGERFLMGVAEARERSCPFVCFTASGGARMQESIVSLMQMAKCAAAVSTLRRETLPYIVVLTDPTMGGVSASLGMIGDIIIAEPGALIGFAGPRVIAQTVKETLPADFQRSEFLLSNGGIDMIVDRRALRNTIARLLSLLTHSPPT